MTTVISVENLSKMYHLGQIGTGTLTNDLKIWWARARGKPNPLLKIGHEDTRHEKAGAMWALNDVSFTVKQGEALGIIGKNGAGKSTLLKILSRITAPTSGKVKVKGRIASLLEVGTGFHPELTGRENIYLNGAISGMSKNDVRRKFDEIVEFSGIAQYIDTPVKRYSSGMYVRLAFAVAAHLEPEILVVDEVLAVGDIEFQQKCLGKMGEVTKTGRTVLFVSHNMPAVTRLCQNAILLDKGRICFTDEVEDVVYKYLELTSSVPANGLLNRAQQTSGNDVHFTRINILNSRHEVTDVLLSGEEVTIELEYTSTRAKPLSKASASVVFVDRLGTNIFGCWNDAVGTPFENLKPSGKFSCRIPRLPLVPGQYSLTIALAVEKQTTDKLTQATSISVVAGDFFGSGKITPASIGSVMVPHEWTYHA